LPRGPGASGGTVDPVRGHVDPGSLRKVDRWYRNPDGGWIHEYGSYWTSYGVPRKNVHHVHADRNYGTKAPDESEDGTSTDAEPEAEE
jgi:hypothetical protein